MRGIWAAVLTPVSDAFEPNVAPAIGYYHDLLRRGCDGINLLGTTGEAMSFSADQRRRFMEAIASSGLPMERVMVGTGAASLHDAVALMRTAFACGFVAALVMPPFFFREASDDGILRFFDALFTRTNPTPKKILLYNFPRMSGIAFHPALVARLVEAFPGIVAGMKDSSNDPQLQSEIVARHPGFSVLPGSERDLLAAKTRGVTGCISGSVALWPELAKAVWTNEDPSKGNELAQKRAALENQPFIPAVRRLTAAQRNDAAWIRSMPPLT